jgi:hypothetical protein
MGRFNVDFACAKNVGSYCAHVAKIVENVESIVSEAEAIDVLEVDSECLVRFGFGEFGAPGVVMPEVESVEFEGSAGSGG